MIYSGSVSEGPTRVNARTGRSLATHAVLAAALACWVELLWSVPRSGPLSPDQTSGWQFLDLAILPAIFLVVWRLLLGRTIEWTVAGKELRRRSWVSMPGRAPATVMKLGPEADIQHQTRDKWLVWPDGLAIHPWPGQTSSLIRGMQQAGVRVDDFRGDWERLHPRLNTLAVVTYCAGLAILLATPAAAIALGSGLPGLPILLGAAALGVGKSIDQQPWKTPKSMSQDG
jgi:hypothetical protein